MSEPKILVTGAPGGTQGRTASTLVELLREAQVPVRAFVHRADARSEALARTGAEIHVGDMLDSDSVRAAMRGIEKVFFCYPVKDGLLDATAIVAEAAKQAQAKFLVNLSQGAASSSNPSPRSRRHWLSERIFDWSGVPAFHLRGGVFFENIFRQFARGIRDRGELRAPFGNGEGMLPLVAARDISRVAFAALVRPEPFIGKTFPIFSELLSLIDVAKQTSEALGRTIRYRQISPEEWIAESTLREERENREQLDHLVNLWKFLLTANESGSLVETLRSIPNLILNTTGESGQTLKSWLASDSLARVVEGGVRV